jgi:hypothetical protein
MSQPVPTADPGRGLDAGALWAGGLATAAVAALVAVVGVLLGEQVLGIDMVEPPLLPIGDLFAVRYACTAALLALVVTAIAHLLVLTTPRPRSFLSWIGGLVVAIGVVLPFAAGGTLPGRITTALLNLVIGICVLTLVRSVLVRAQRRGRRGDRTYPDPGGSRGSAPW